jgi:DNA-binding NarL/FixJ family response regulator
MSAEKIRLVIAEDETMLRESLAELMRLEDDIEVVGTASNGEIALSVCRHQKPHVLLTDINMPIRDGISLTETLKAEMPDVGVVILTIYGDDDKVFAAVKAGARGYVLKDSPRRDTVQAIRAVAHGECLANPQLMLRVWMEFGRMQTKTNADKEKIEELTEREKEILIELGHGKRNKDIADTLCITEKTVKNHISNIFEKLQINSRAEAALLAARQGLV